MDDAFVYDEAALAKVISAVAGAMDDLGQEAVGIVYGMAPKGARGGKYRRSIGASTYANGKYYAGKHLKNIGQMSHADVLTVVYTSSPLGHLLERGTQPIDVDAPNPWPMHFTAKSGDEVYTYHVRNRRVPRQPHFGPGAMASVGRAASVISAGIARRIR